MATGIAALHQVWDCRWSRPGHRLTGVADADQPESTWVCVRKGERRNIEETVCRTCAHWAAMPGAAPTAAVAVATAAPGIEAGRLLVMSTRLVLILNAFVFAALGVVTLTSPLAVPFTVALWLCAAGFAGLVAFWRPAVSAGR